MPELIIKSASTKGARDFPEGTPLFVGRTSQCDIYLPSPTVSRRHAVFLAKNGEYGLKDMGSSNGTFLNGKRLQRPMRLKNGDVIAIGEFQIEFRAAEQPGLPDEGMDDNLARRTTVFNAAALQARLNLKSGPAAKPATKPENTPTPASARPPAPSRAAPAVQPAPTPGFLAPATPNQDQSRITTDIQQTPRLEATPRPPPPQPEAGPVEAREVRGRPEPPARGEAEIVAPGTPPRPAEPENGEPLEDGKTESLSESEMLPLDDDGDMAEAADDDSLADDGDGEEENAARADALAKAAAEAGLVGEFAPDVEDEPGGGGGGGVNLPVSDSGTFEPNPDAIPIDDAFRQAIETRLCLYSFLADMKKEREDFIARRPKMADAVKSELARQDREIDKMPNPDQAENMIGKRRAKQKDLIERIKAAEKSGAPPPPRPSRDMYEAEELAISQWTFFIQSGREALPAAFREGFHVVGDEPLARLLAAEGIDPEFLMGGGAYHLALEALLEEIKARRADIRARMANTPDPNQKKSKGGMLGFFGRSGADDDEDGEDGAEVVEDYGALVDADQDLANRSAWIAQELAQLEKDLIVEFWRVYAEAALRFIPGAGTMPVEVRAFLRHGAIGFKKWWMKEEVRGHILHDCATDVVPRMTVGKNITNILYADEYLSAVMNMECTPALDENLEMNERNSPNWKADKALRRIINSRSQATLMEELLGSLGDRLEKLDQEAAGLDDRISKLLTGTKNYKQAKNELGQKRQAVRVEASKLGNLINKIRGETLATLREAMAETEERFKSGELPKPTTEFLIRRECQALRKIGRLLANLKERFMPLVLRDSFFVDTDAVNDRISINGEIADMERRDPALFLETLVPSKKKANRVDLRISPTIVLIPAAGVLAYSWNPRSRPEDGRLAIPTCFIRRRIRERQIIYLLADFRWDTSKAAAGMDIMTSETIVAAFMTVRWDWRKRSKEGREKGLIYTEQNDRTNWRRVYEAYIQSAFDGGKKLYNRNYDFYERIIGKYFDLPEGVPLLRK